MQEHPLNNPELHQPFDQLSYALKIEKDLSMHHRLYLQVRNTKDMDPKRIAGKKRTTRDIKHLDNILKKLSLEEWRTIRSQL